MAYILDARSQAEQMPRLAWLEATGNGDEIRLTFATSIGVVAQGVGRTVDLESLAIEGGECVFSGDLWVERTDQPHLWAVSVITAPTAGTFCLNAYDFTFGLQQIQLDRLTFRGDQAHAANDTPSGAGVGNLASLQTVRGSSFEA